DRTRGEGEQSRVVIAGRGALRQVVGPGNAEGDAQRAERARCHRAKARPEPRIQATGDCEHQHRDEPTYEVVGWRHSRFGLEIAVVDDMQRDDTEGESHHPQFRAKRHRESTNDARAAAAYAETVW